MQPSDPDYNRNRQARNPYYSENPSTPPPEMFARPSRAMVIWRTAATVYALAAMAIAVYWEFTGGEPARMTCEWQTSVFNAKRCYMLLDIFLPMLVLLMPLLIIKFIIEKITGIKLVNPKFRG